MMRCSDDTSLPRRKTSRHQLWGKAVAPKSIEHNHQNASVSVHTSARRDRQTKECRKATTRQPRSHRHL